MFSNKVILKNYSEFLSLSWPKIIKLCEVDTTESLQIDWLQANWEFMVEGVLDTSFPSFSLEVYGEGADCNGNSSRVLYPSLAPTHRFMCKPINDDSMYDYLNKKHIDKSEHDVIFDSFVCLENGWYFEKPPFDKVLALYLDEYVVLDFDEIDFELKPIND